MPTSTSEILTALRARATALGFAECRVVSPQAAAAERARLMPWLASGAHGDMDWMRETAARRADPAVLWPGVRSILMLTMNYGPDSDPLAARHNRQAGNISVYARHRDYHDVVKGKLKLLAGFLAAQAGCAVKVFVDTAPVMEKPLAAAAGLGWQGKHTNLVSRSHGSWLFLGSIFTSLEIPADAPEADHCGSCRACLDVCPTQAFPAPYQLDARRCISYLTIEHQGEIPPEFRRAIGNRIYGCDDCLAVCPWNKFAQVARDAKLQARADLVTPSLRMLAGLDDAGFRQLFAGSPVKRIGHTRFLRNVLVAIGNAQDKDLMDCVERHMTHASPLVRGMAVWAAGQLAAAARVAQLYKLYGPAETAPGVRAEWILALGIQETAA